MIFHLTNVVHLPSAYIVLGSVGYSNLPLVPILFDKIMPLNESRQRIFILEGSYFVDRFEPRNYLYICLFEWSACVGMLFMVAANDTTYATCVEQCLGLMDVVK